MANQFNIKYSSAALSASVNRSLKLMFAETIKSSVQGDILRDNYTIDAYYTIDAILYHRCNIMQNLQKA